MRAHFIFARLKFAVPRLLLVVAAVLAVCQLTLCLRSSSVGVAQPALSANANSTLPGGGNALSLAWSVVSGAETRPTMAADRSAAEGAGRRSVRSLVGVRSLNSMWVIGLALLVIVGLGIPLGILRGRSRRNPLAWLLALPFAVGVCLPVFWLAATAAWWMLEHRSLPLPGDGASGGFEVVVTGSRAWLVERWPGFLVAALIALTGTGWLMRTVSGGIQHAALADHLWVGRMRGMREARLFYRHTLRNALRPIVMSVADLLPFVFGAAILAEGVLGFPGIGGMVYEAASQRDDAILLAGGLLIAVSVLAARLVGEVVLGLLDPSEREEGLPR